MEKNHDNFLAIIMLTSFFLIQIASAGDLTTPVITPCPSTTPTPDTLATITPITPIAPTISPTTMPLPTPVPCDWTCQLIPIGAPSMEVAGMDEYGTPTSVKDTTAYMCSIKTSTDSCTPEQKANACKPISDPSSNFRSSPVVEATGKVNVLITVVSSFKCGDKITIGPPNQKLFADCGNAKRAWDTAKKEAEKACDSAKIKEAKEKCTEQKSSVEKAKAGVDEATKIIDWKKSELKFEQQKLDEMKTALSQFKTEYDKLKADVDKKEIVFQEAEKDLANYKKLDDATTAESIVSMAGPVGKIWNAMQILMGNFKKILTFIEIHEVPIGEGIEVGQIRNEVKEVKEKVEAAEREAASAKDAYESALAYMKATGVEQSIQDYENKMIPETEAKITEAQKTIKDAEESLQEKTEAYNTALAELEKCSRSGCENAKSKEKEAYDNYQACIK